MLRKPSLMAFLNLAHFVDHYCLLIFPTAVLGLAEGWGLTYDVALALGSGGYIAFALASLPAGWLGDRWGRVATLRLFFPGLAIGLLVVGTAEGATQLAVGMVLLGIAAAIYHPVATALLMQISGGSGRALAINGLWGNMGVAAAALGTGVITAELGWRWSFLLPSFLLVLAALGFLVCVREEASSSAPKARSAAGAAKAALLSPWRALVLIALSAFCGGLVFNGVTFALPKLFAERLSDHLPDLASLGLVTGLVFALAGFAQLPVGRLLDQSGARLPLVLATGLQTLLLAALFLTQGAVALPLAAVLLLLVFGEIPITAWLLGHVVPQRWLARVYGVQHLLSLGVAALVLPLIASLYAATGSSGALFGLLGFAAALVAVAGFFLLRVGNHSCEEVSLSPVPRKP